MIARSGSGSLLGSAAQTLAEVAYSRPLLPVNVDPVAGVAVSVTA